MESLITHLLNGLVYSMLLFILSAGLSLIFGLMNVVNMAHGSFYMLGAYVGLAVVAWTGNFWLAALLAPLFAGFVGAGMERIFFRPLYKRPDFDQIILTFGFTFVFIDVVKWIWGAGMQNLALPDAIGGGIQVLGAVFPLYRLVLIGIGLVLGALMWFLLDRSRIGAMVRASVDDRPMAMGLGINVGSLFTGVFSLGVALAAFAGVIAGPVIAIYPGMDIDILIPAFIVVVIGGMGSLRGAFVASILIGEVDTLGKAYFPSSAMFLIYLLMVGVLLLRPSGLFGIRDAH